MKLLSVKPFRQSAGYCGPASFKMVLAYYGVKKSEQNLVQLCKSSKAKGTTPEHLLQGAKRLGFKGFIKEPSDFSDMKKYVQKKEIPVIVNWFSGDDGHYSVVVGLDQNKIYLLDPELGKVKKMDLATFKRVWFDFSGDFLRSAYDLRIRLMLVIFK